jgi:P-type E1-E2 ATPase
VYNCQTNSFEQKQWRNIYPGEIIKIYNDEHIPCDVLMLASSEVNGLCYVETKNLDGETNLKIKKVHADMQEAFHEEEVLLKVDGEVICEKPNNAIYKFEGTAKIK